MEEGESEAGKEIARKGVALSKACGHLCAVLLGLWGSQCRVVPCSQEVRKWGYFSTNLQEAQGSWLAGTQCHGMAVLKCPAWLDHMGWYRVPIIGIRWDQGQEALPRLPCSLEAPSLPSPALTLE